VPLRSTASLVLLSFFLAASAAAAAPRSASGISPSLVHRGQKTTITVATFSTVPCIAILSYADGRSKALPMKHPRNQRVTFVARIPTDGSPIVAQPQVLNNGILVQTLKGGVYAIAIQ